MLSSKHTCSAAFRLELTSGDQSTHDGSRLAGNLARNGVGILNVVTPVTSSNGDDGQLGNDDGTSDGGSDFLGDLDTETDVTVKVTDGNESLESGSLTGRGLLLNGRDGHDFVLQGGQELVDDLELLDGQREEVDFLHRLDLSVVDQSTELGDRDPGEAAVKSGCRFDGDIALPRVLRFGMCLTGLSQISKT
jgi:hypothetical protein